MVETVDTLSLPGARRGDCLVEAVVKCLQLLIFLFNKGFITGGSAMSNISYISELEFKVYVTESVKYVAFFQNVRGDFGCGSHESDDIKASVLGAAQALVSCGESLLSMTNQKPLGAQK